MVSQVNLDYDIRRIQHHLMTVLKVAGKRFDEYLLYHVAQRGWFERQKKEKAQTEFAHVCWAAELFAASELLLKEKPTEFEGVAALLSICAVDALDATKSSEMSTRAALTESLVRQCGDERSAIGMADRLWNFRCAGVHLGLTDRLDVMSIVKVGENHVSRDTFESVMSEHRRQGSNGPVNLIEQAAFSRNMYLFRVARHTSAEAIGHRVVFLMGKITKRRDSSTSSE